MNRLLLLSLLLAAGTSCRADATLSLTPASQTVPLGAEASFAVDISGLGNGTSLGTYDINVGFDSSLLSYGSIVFGNQLDLSGLGDIQSVTPGIGMVEVFELSLDPPTELNSLQSDAFTLATVTFDTVSVGTSPVSLSVNALGDAYGNSITAVLKDASISVNTQTAVPEPASFWLLLAVLPISIVARRH